MAEDLLEGKREVVWTQGPSARRMRRLTRVGPFRRGTPQRYQQNPKDNRGDCAGITFSHAASFPLLPYPHRDDIAGRRLPFSSPILAAGRNLKVVSVTDSMQSTFDVCQGPSGPSGYYIQVIRCLFPFTAGPEFHQCPPYSSSRRSLLLCFSAKPMKPISVTLRRSFEILWLSSRHLNSFTKVSVRPASRSPDDQKSR